MFEKILEGLKAKFAGVQDSTLRRIATKMAQTATTEEAATTAVEAATFQQVLESYADSRATEASASAVANYESKHGLKDGKIATAPAGDKDPIEKDAKPAWAIEQEKLITDLQGQLAAKNANEIAGARLAKVNAAIAAAPLAYQNTVREAFKVANYSDDAAFDAHLQVITTDATSLATTVNQQGAAFGGPLKSNPAPNTDTVPANIQALFDGKDKPDGQKF